MQRFGWSYEQCMANPHDLLEEIAERWHWESHWTSVKEESDQRKADAMKRRVG